MSHLCAFSMYAGATMCFPGTKQGVVDAVVLCIQSLRSAFFSPQWLTIMLSENSFHAGCTQGRRKISNQRAWNSLGDRGHGAGEGSYCAQEAKSCSSAACNTMRRHGASVRRAPRPVFAGGGSPSLGRIRRDRGRGARR